MRAGRQIAISRMLEGREVFVRIAPRREFQPGRGVSINTKHERCTEWNLVLQE